MSSHIIDGEFQSDKYPTTPRGKVPLSVKDPTAQDLLWTYAQRRRAMDAEFADDLETALVAAGYLPIASASPAENRRNVIGTILYEELCDLLGDDQAERIARIVDRLLGSELPEDVLAVAVDAALSSTPGRALKREEIRPWLMGIYREETER
jgi:hypothetical protein